MFYTVVRKLFKGGKETHSMEDKETYDEAEKRFYNIIASDLSDPEITYNSAYIINSDGLMMKGEVFKREVVE